MIYTQRIYSNNIQFEWDENKNQINIEKHGISFEEAMEIFRGICFTKISSKNFFFEKRYTCLGEVEEEIFFIVYTIRGNKIRLISARKASKKERIKYHEIQEK